MLIKQKSPSLLRNLALGTFGELPTVFSTKVNLLYLLYSTVRRCCLLPLIKHKLFAENFSKNSNLDDSGISLPVFPSRTNLKLHNFGELPTVFSTKVNLLYLLYSTVRRCCLLPLIKHKLFAENFSKNSNLDDSGISLPVFPSRTNLKLHNIYVTPKMVKKVITNLDLSKASGPDCLPVVVLKKCEPELSYILA